MPGLSSPTRTEPLPWECWSPTCWAARVSIGVPVWLFAALLCALAFWRVACKACGVFSVVHRMICEWWYEIFIPSAIRMALTRPPVRLGRGRVRGCSVECSVCHCICHLKAVSVSPLFDSIRVRSHCNIVLNLSSVYWDANMLFIKSGVMLAHFQMLNSEGKSNLSLIHCFIF